MNVELYNKKTKDILLIPVKDFINPKSETAKETGLKPKGFQSATWMLCDLMNHEMYSNAEWAVVLEGNHKFGQWGYNKKEMIKL